MSVNKVILVGNLGADPEKKVTGSGSTVTNFRIATSTQWTDKTGQRQEKTEWHSIEVWGGQAEPCATYLAKGRQVYVEGRLQTDQWEDPSGVKKYRTKVVAQRVIFLGGKGAQGQGQSHDNQAPSAPPDDANPGFVPPEDVPF